MTTLLFVIILIVSLYTLEFKMIMLSVIRPPLWVERWLDQVVPRWARSILADMAFCSGTRLQIPILSKSHQLPKQFIVVSNHQSLIDILVLYALFPDHGLRFIAKSSLRFCFPAVTRALKLGHHAFVNRRGDPVGAVKTIRSFALRCARMGKCPVIFPEGTRSRDGRLGEFQPAGFRVISAVCRLPVVVVVLEGGYKISSIQAIATHGPTEYKIKVLETLPAPETKTQIVQTLEKAHTLIAQELNNWRKVAV